jgi:membrane-associated phospholipid phosphatase
MKRRFVVYGDGRSPYVRNALRLYSIKCLLMEAAKICRLLIICLLLLPGSVRAQSEQSSDCDDDSTQNCQTPVSRSFLAVKAYVTAPLHWRSREWLTFAGAVAAIGLSHHYDSQVRTHFTDNSPAALNSSNTHTLTDALPAAALFVGTWGYATLIDDSDGRREAGAMLEATVLSIGTAYVLNYASGRKGPDQTTDPNQWWSGGSSFPSEHTTAAFAIGTVLAESGNSDYRWVRRVIGYGVGGYTAYERLSHNAHWLSDTVAGAALGAASARFAMNRETSPRGDSAATLALTPLPHGLMLRYAVHPRWGSD